MKNKKNKNKLFIGISGKMGTGKSTISHMLQAIMPKSTIMSMATPMYGLQKTIYKRLNLKLEGDKDRDLLIALGGWGRSKDPDFWVTEFAKSSMKNNFEIIICDDIRFPNEADFFKEYGVLVRLEGEQRGDNVDESKSTNITECALDDYKFEHVISNKQKPSDICKAIANIMIGDSVGD